MKKYVWGSLLILLCACSSQSSQSSKLDVDADLEYCEVQVKKSLEVLDDTTKMPRNICLIEMNMYGIVLLSMIGLVASGQEYFGMYTNSQEILKLKGKRNVFHLLYIQFLIVSLTIMT